MSNATLTLLGLYQYGKRHDIDLFDSLTLPTGINHDIAVANILHNCADYEVLYPDFDFMKTSIEMFSTKWQRTFEKWVEVMNIEYDPLENYNRYENWSDSTSESSSSETSMSAHDSTSESTANSNNISAFNSPTMEPDTSAALSGQTAGNSSSDGKNQNQLDRFNEHGGRIHGNIGVMTTQAMFKEEWELDKLNIYDEIMVLFAREFLIPFTY